MSLECMFGLGTERDKDEGFYIFKLSVEMALKIHAKELMET